jgi:hypothetical protein
MTDYIATTTDHFGIGPDTFDLVNGEAVPPVSDATLVALIEGGHVREADADELTGKVDDAHQAVIEQKSEELAEAIVADAEAHGIEEQVVVEVTVDKKDEEDT